MRSVLLVLAIAACGGGGTKPSASTTTPPAATAKPATPPAAAPAESPLDEGSFTMTVDGQPMATETFRITSRDGKTVVRSTTDFTYGGLRGRVVGELVVEPVSWKPVSGHLVLDDGARQQEVVLHRGVGALEQKIGGAAQRETTPSDIYLVNNVSAHATAFCLLAGDAERQLSAFPGLAMTLGPREPFQGGLSRVALVIAPDARVDLVCDGWKLVVMREPMQRVVSVRKGYEAAAAALAAADRAKPPTPDSVVEEERSVKVDGAVLACAFMRPKTTGKVKPGAVVLLNGSGAQDRDSDTVGPGGLKLALLKLIAVELAARGVASLRCDDRGTAKSTGSLEKMTLDTLTDDAVAMLGALAAEPTVDRARLGVIGHSEGAVIALVAATRGKPKLRAVGLLSGTGRPLDLVLMEQAERSLRAANVDAAESQRMLTRQRKLYDAIRDDTALPADLTPEERAVLETSAGWFRSHFRADPAALVAKVDRKTAVLVAQGEKDVQVSPRDAQLLHEAAKKAKVTVTYKTYPELNHLFTPSRAGGLADYTSPDAQVDPTFLADVAAFAAAALGERP